MTVEFKSPEIHKEYDECCLILKLLSEDFIRCSNTFNITPVMTRVLEKIEGSSGVHEAGRAVDFRCEHGGSFLYSDAQMSYISEYINSKWNRIDGKQSLIWHSFNGNPLHAHLQISTSTVIYMPKVKS